MKDKVVVVLSLFSLLVLVLVSCAPSADSNYVVYNYNSNKKANYTFLPIVDDSGALRAFSFKVKDGLEEYTCFGIPSGGIWCDKQ